MLGLGASFGCDALDGIALEGGATCGGGRRAVLRLTFGLVMVPYFGANSRGSSSLVRECISRVMSDKICKSFNGCGPML